ncbi:hypothetical protein C8R44DRAFT_294557 [Mycena epipterygia]|nr:hypothetical protein C8R44DRAFT_294557 [Mycena epipterygia]
MNLQNPSTLSGSSRTMLAGAAATPRREPQQRVSHQMHSAHEAATTEQSTPPLPDVFSHPAVLAFLANHPNRPLPKFGVYYVLNTLGEGEFGKVKLGLHSKYGEEVAIKLIRRETADNEAKMSKIAREIEILDQLKHPNIVRLYDVYETDKFFGIILEYASGGELFDHILAHRYLRERDASKLFSQLISGVWYMHQKNIVHRDLKLENLLLDRHRNLIITDFGFANHFNRSKNDLMETMCGSPCYAAPELVNSEGLYVGTAADIWSCGVILYAMLSGYLPFDDDPTNPDGEDITKLYAYIARTPLSFPDHISDEARSLLGAMLVPDPHARADLATIMRHPWFAAYMRELSTFGLTVKELEKLAEDGPTLRRLAYQRGVYNRDVAPQSPRSQQRSKSKRNEVPESASPYGGEAEWDPFAQTAAPLKDTVGSPRKQRAAERSAGEKGKEREREQGRKEEKFRHTIQVEYEEQRGARDGRQRERQQSSRGPSEGRRTPTTPATALPVVYDGTASVFKDGGASDPIFITETPRRRRASRSSGTKPGSPSVRSVLATSPVVLSLESTAEAPSPDLSLGRPDPANAMNGEKRAQRDLEVMNARPFYDRPNHPRTDVTPASLSNGAKAQLHPLIIDGGSNAPGAKQTFTQTMHPNMSDVGTQGSPIKPNKVMQWFRRGRRSGTVSGGLSPITFLRGGHDAAASSVEVASVPHKSAPPPQPASPFLVTPGTSEHRQRTTSAVSITSLFRRSASVAGPSSGGNRTALRIHHGAVDNEMITAGRPPEVMQHMQEVLSRMGVEVQVEGDFKYRCIRPAKRRDRRDIIAESPVGASSQSLGGGVFRGLLSRRQPSPARPAAFENSSSNSSSVLPADRPSYDVVYGDMLEDVGDEVRFSVELTRLDRLKDMYSLDIRRLKGNLKSYKFLYNTLRTRAQLQR